MKRSALQSSEEADDVISGSNGHVMTKCEGLHKLKFSQLAGVGAQR